MALNTKTGEMALNAERGWIAALNVERKTNHGSERQNWKPMMKALNAKLKIVMTMALNAKLKMLMMALNAELRSDDGSECQNWEVMKDLNAETRRIIDLEAKSKS